MNINIEQLKITNNQAENRFEVWIEKQLSKMDYIKDGKTLVLTHVGVHPTHRGQGVAAKLTQAGLEYAKENSLRVIPMCSYVAGYIRRNPQYIDLTKAQADE